MPTKDFFPRRRRVMTLAPLLLLLTLAATASADLSADVRGRLVDAPKKASVAVEIVSLGDRPADKRVLFAEDASRPMTPASNLKLLTTAAALDGLGADFKFRTVLLVRGDGRDGYEAAVVGDGDPSFGDSALLRDVDGWGVRTVLRTWADALQKAGVTKLSALKLDDSVFDQQRVNDNWPLDQRHRWYEAQVGGLNLNLNCLDVYLTRGNGGTMDVRLDPPTQYPTVQNTCRVGDKNAVWLTRAEGGNVIQLAGQTNAREQGPMQVTIDDPTAYFGTVLAETLRAGGVETVEPTADRAIRTAWQAQAANGWNAADPAQWRAVAIHETRLADVLNRTNKDSINLYAECLAKRLAFKTGGGEPGSWAGGARAVKAYLAQIGDESANVTLDDGCGLSRLNKVTAAAMCDVLAAQHYGPAAEVYRNSLSEAGSDGTLEGRFAAGGRRALRGRVFGKTGYINNVSTFSGYLLGRDGRWYAYSILVNDCPRAQIGEAKTLQEEIVLALDESLTPATATARN